MARPTKLTKAVSEKIVAAIRAGNYVEAAARSAGIDPTTYYRWLERGKSTARADKAFREFHDAIRKAEGEAEVHAVALVRKAMPDNWQAAMTYLERRYPDRWRRREHVEVSGKKGGPIEVNLKDPETARLAHELLARLPVRRDD